jgi:hypothetical protein
VKTVVYGDFVGSSCDYHFLEVLDGFAFFQTLGEEPIELAFGVEKVIVGVNDDNRCISWHDEKLLEIAKM